RGAAWRAGSARAVGAAPPRARTRPRGPTARAGDPPLDPERGRAVARASAGGGGALGRATPGTGRPRRPRRAGPRRRERGPPAGRRSPAVQPAARRRPGGVALPRVP